MANWQNVQQGLVSGFQVGGQTGGQGIGAAISKVANRLREQRVAGEEMAQKQNLLGFAGMTEGKIVQAQPNETGAFNIPNMGWFKKAPSAEMDIINRIISQGGQTPNLMGQDWKMNKIDLGPVTLERTPTEEEAQQTISRKVQEKQAEELAKGIPTSEAGRISLAKESIKNIQDVKKYLFPTGKASSFKRTTAFASNLPGGSLPLLPQRGWGKAEQEVFRKMGASLSGRQLIQTGVAARPEETQKLVSQFAPSVGSNPEAALAGLNELEDFYKDYIKTVKTRGINQANDSQDNDGFQITPSGNKYKIIQ